jgi:penicillin-binding protein 2
MRIGKVIILAGILLFILIARIFQLEIIQGNFYYALSNKNCIRVIPYEGVRGRILGRNSEVIVDNQIAYNVSIIPQEFKQNSETLSQLAILLNKSTSQITKSIKKDFVSSFAPIIVAKNVDKKMAFLIEENKLNLPGVIIQIIS